MSKKKTVRASEPAPMYQLKIELAYVEPTVWRRLLVRGDMTLGLLHTVIQVAMGWTNSHLHDFAVGDARYTELRMDYDMGPGVPASHDENKASLQYVAPKTGTHFGYEYDLGDCWEHFITVEKIHDPEETTEVFARCLDGGRACPPDDCGGPIGYADLLEIIRDPEHEEHESMLEWLGGGFDPEAFDLQKVNICLALLKWPRTTEGQLAAVLMKRDGVS